MNNMKNQTNADEDTQDFFEAAIHHMPRGHGFCLRDLFEEDWKHFSKAEKANLDLHFYEGFAIGDTPALINLGVNDQGHTVFTKPFQTVH